MNQIEMTPERKAKLDAFLRKVERESAKIMLKGIGMLLLFVLVVGFASTIFEHPEDFLQCGFFLSGALTGLNIILSLIDLFKRSEAEHKKLVDSFKG